MTDKPGLRSRKYYNIWQNKYLNFLITSLTCKSIWRQNRVRLSLALYRYWNGSFQNYSWKTESFDISYIGFNTVSFVDSDSPGMIHPCDNELSHAYFVLSSCHRFSI